MNRPCSSLARALRTAALAALVSLAHATSSLANPIAPTFFGVTGSQFVDIYLNATGAPASWSWFAMPECTPPQADSLNGTSAVALVGTWGDLAVCGVRRGTSWSGAALYSAMPWSCEVRRPLTSVNPVLSGLQYVGGTIYGIGYSDPPTSGTASLWTLDPASGAASEIGSLGSAAADEIVSGLAWDANAHVFYTLTCCRGPLDENQDAFIARIDPASGQCTGKWRVLDTTGAPMTYLRALEWAGGYVFVAIHAGDELFALAFVGGTYPGEDGYWLATRITPTSPGAVGGLVDLAWTGVSVPFPSKTSTWGGLKARYR